MHEHDNIHIAATDQAPRQPGIKLIGSRLGRLLRKDDSRSNMAFKIARNKLTQHQRSDASSNSRCFVSAIPLHEEEAVTHCHPMNCVVLPDLTSVSAPFRNLEIEWRQGKKTLSRDEPTNSRPNSKQPAKARKGLVLFSNGCHLNSSTDNLPSRVPFQNANSLIRSWV
jgi:hypothetical protein